LDSRRAALLALTDRLMEVESVDASELKRIIDENSPGPLVVPGTAAANRPAVVSSELLDSAAQAKG
jgi:cell division protease FtsH